ncbi:mucin-5AC [Drosophila grimshawi]|uniref:mucin-5AC n=1 Tax=Drosophila grimshawi TaxID=7222 RepID=UPI001C933ECA|nr:mucin-5AC [Drosophila grimshawi]
MKSIVLHSDIARLILGYLLNNDLRHAALTFCRTSTHLKQEFVALCQGLQPHNFLNGGLEDIIREHVKVTSIVANTMQKLPISSRHRLQQLKLSERIAVLLKLDKSTSSTAGSRDTACQRNANSNTQRKRRRTRDNTMSEDEHLSSSPEQISCKRMRVLAPHLCCSVELSSRNVSDPVEDSESLNSSSTTGTDITSSHTDEGLTFRGHGPKNNSTPRAAKSDKPEVIMPVPQTMPELTQVIMTNEDFQAKLLNNINVALQSLTVHAPTVESVNSEAVLDGLVRNILEAIEKDPSFDRIIQEVVGMEAAPVEPVPSQVATEPQPQTPLIIRSAIASANAVLGADSKVSNGGNANAVIQLNANSTINNLIDPNFSISKLIVLNSNESAQKHHPQSGNLSFGIDNLLNFGVDGGSALPDFDATAGRGGQVCVDATNGQLTFPMLFSNEGMISHLPFLVKNEWLAQQLRSDVFTNPNVSHIEIPLPEPIIVTANQLPPNSIIINSAVKQSPTALDASLIEPPPQLIAEHQTNPVTAITESKVPASLDSSRLVLERVTPSTSGIVNVKAFRSLSTPRKRASHVRTLNFSPKVAATHNTHITPVSTRRMQHLSRRVQLNTLKEKHAEQKTQIDVQPEKPIIINNVEILPSAVASSPGAETASGPQIATPAGAADGSGNDSNSCVPPLFVMEESSNQTVIKAVTASSKQTTTQSKQTPSMVATLKRKQKRRAAAKASKAVRMGSENNPGKNDSNQTKQTQSKPVTSATISLDDSKENQRMQIEQLEMPASSEKGDLLAAWHRQIHGTSADLDQRLRAINAKREELFNSSMSMRRMRPVAASKKKTLTPLAPKQKKLKSPPLRAKKSKRKQLLSEEQQQQQHQQTYSAEGEFNIKITTPKKLTPKKSAAVSCQELRHPKDTTETEVVGELKKPEEIKEQDQKTEEQQQQNVEAVPSRPDIREHPADRMDRCMPMSLQETPLKLTPSEAGDVPPTPGPTLMPPPETPYPQLLLPSTSFLFGSDTKSILDTPMLMAITPGVHLTTPFGHSLGTPHSSGAKTDHSSCSSYYRPDEAEHMDTNAQCALQPTESPPKEDHIVEQISTTTITATCIELHAERLPVEPTVLRRVRSFGCEAVDSAEGAVALAANADHPLVETPHYKLVSGLPDVVVENSNSSSSTSSSSTTTSSSFSSSSSATSSSNTSAASSSAQSSQVARSGGVLPTRSIKLLDMENLSDISSTEDEEWLKAAAAGGSLDVPPLAIESEPTQLVSQDGEVRYPLRNWLTPSKDAGAETSSAIVPPANCKKTLLTRNSAEKLHNQGTEDVEQRMQDLAKVRERVKAKCKQESQLTPKSRTKKSNRKLTVIRKTAQLANHPNKTPKKKQISQPTTPIKALQGKPAAVPAEVPAAVPAAVPAVPAAGPVAAPVPEAGAVIVKSLPSPAPHRPVKTTQPSLSEALKASIEQPSSSSSDLDPALLIALNLSAKKQQQPAARVAMEIAAQPVPSTTTGQRRGRPRKPTNAEPPRGCMRRSSRLIDNKTPAPEEPQPSGIEATKPAKTSTIAKVTKKPAKKRAEARLESAAGPTLTTLAEAHTTQQLPDHQPPSAASSFTSGEYELDMCWSANQVGNTYNFTYANSGSKPAQSVPRQSPDYFNNFQMRIMVDSEIHNVRITHPQLLHQSLPSAEEECASVTSIRNIPKKRIIQFNNGAKQDQPNVEKDKPMASSTPLTTRAQSVERDNNDLEVVAINTALKDSASEEQQMEPHDAGVQIEDIESILSHLHGT